jgi:hypothetical protein
MKGVQRMKMKTAIAAVATVLALGATAALWAAVPPPPVNQNLFIYDTSISTFTVPVCLGCHTSPVQTDPTLINVPLETRHHALLSKIPTPSCNNITGTVPATLATGCHMLTIGPAGTSTIADPTDCISCHGTGSPHHTTTFVQNQDCKHCHGAAVDNPNDGHVIPTSPINSTVTGMTPDPVGRTVVNPAGGTEIVQGCAACHQASLTATPKIYDNQTLHHGTGIGQGAPGTFGQCTWCHNTSAGTNSNIRGCENCHGINSLHSIQFDSPNAANRGTIVPGAEDLGYGHVGNNYDCVGCHNSWTGASTGSDTTATVPAISNLTQSIFTAGQEATLTINGNGFINTDTLNTTTYTPVVELVNNGITTTLTPSTPSVSQITVILPATLPVGNYEVRVDKSGTISNKVNLTVAPAVAVKAAVLSGQTLTISGTGFGSAPVGAYKSKLTVTVGGVPATVISWSDSRIIASSPNFAAKQSVSVNTLYGQVSGIISAMGKKLK